ncbi:MAG TPA: hypothetical protein PKY51_10085 [Fimbriimonadaceae bacterium]|jgi:hypothetical protein|nr:hypothetical protein [Fimbriimonadaceae bacterium]
MKITILALTFAALMVAHGTALAQEHQGHKPNMTMATELPKPPDKFPAWMSNRTADHLFYKPASYNWEILRVRRFAQDMFATGVGHARAYEALATGQAPQLETRIYEEIVRVLKNPPSIPIDEQALAPTFLRKYGSLEKVFDWAHILHFQTIDVLSKPNWTDAQKEAEIEKLWQFYSAQPYAITGLPMNMAYLDGFSYSATFRKNYPKVNGLFWGYHWLQTVNYDMLYRTPVETHAAQYEVLGARYIEEELFKTDRDFMPMTAETSPRFAKRFPQIANAFDNLHMLHDNVNDILSDSRLTEQQRKEQVNIAIWRVLASTHQGEESGTGEPNTLHDHRHPMGMPGMGMMKGSDEELMFMSGMGWMNMTECAHCSISLPESGPWGATVTANGWTMTVRCMLCARDMASETIGRAIIRGATEDPNKTIVLISDEEGNWKTNFPNAVFLEVMADHPECSGWSRVFTSKAAFDAYVKENPEYKDAEPLTLSAWAQKNGGKPETYRRVDKPNPYRSDPPPASDEQGGAQ